MRRSLSFFAAAAMLVGASAMTFGSAQAAAPRAAPSVPAASIQDGAIVKVADNWRNGWRRDGRRSRHAEGRRDYRYYRPIYPRYVYPRPRYYGFPFAFVPPYYPYAGYGNCYRAWNGVLICG